MVNREFYEEARLQHDPLLFRLVNLYTDILHICSYLEFTHVDLLRLLPKDVLRQVRYIAFPSHLVPSIQPALQYHADAHELQRYLPNLERSLFVIEVDTAEGRNINTFYRPLIDSHNFYRHLGLASAYPQGIEGNRLGINSGAINAMLGDFSEVGSPEWNPDVQFAAQRQVDARAPRRAWSFTFRGWIIPHIVRMYRLYFG
jgi:hypothetical protein